MNYIGPVRGVPVRFLLCVWKNWFEVVFRPVADGQYRCPGAPDFSCLWQRVSRERKLPLAGMQPILC